MAAPRAARSWSQDPHHSHFSGTKAKPERERERDSLRWHRWGYPGREGEAPPAGGALLSFRAPPNEF